MQLIKQLRFLVAGVSMLTASSAYAVTDAQQVVRHASDQVIAALEAEKETLADHPEKIYALVDQHVLPLFDFDRMSYYVLGRAWKEASDEQKAVFQDEFKYLLISTYATALAEFTSEEEIVYLPVQTSSNPKVMVVPTEIRQKAGSSIAVAYRMYLNADAWQIFDVVIDGVSLVTNYRASFSGQIRKGGLDGLIASLRAHNKKKTAKSGDQAMSGHMQNNQTAEASVSQ